MKLRAEIIFIVFMRFPVAVPVVASGCLSARDTQRSPSPDAEKSEPASRCLLVLPEEVGKSLAVLPQGTARCEVEEIAGSSGCHQFTAFVDGHELVVVSYALKGGFGRRQFYFVFQDQSLVHIVNPPPQPHYIVVDEQGDRLMVNVPVDPRQMVQATQGMTDLDSAEIIEHAGIGRPSPPSDTAVPIAIAYGTACALAGPLCVYRELEWKNYREQAREQVREYERRFDPFKISLRMTEAEVEHEFGGSVCRIPLDRDESLRVYGPFRRIRHDYGVTYSSAPVGVVFDNGRVTAVYSHSFSPIALLDGCPEEGGTSDSSVAPDSNPDP